FCHLMFFAISVALCGAQPKQRRTIQKAADPDIFYLLPERPDSVVGVGGAERDALAHPFTACRVEQATIAGVRLSMRARAIGQRRPARRAAGAGMASETIEPEQLDVVARLAALGQIGHDLANHAGKLEAMARARRGKRHLRIARVQIDDEVVIRRICEYTGLQRHRRPSALGEVALGQIAQHLLVAQGRLALELLGVDELLQVVVAPELEARYPMYRKA